MRRELLSSRRVWSSRKGPLRTGIAGVMRQKRQNAPFISRAAARASFRQALRAFRERLRWARRWLSPLTTHPPSTAPATASSNPTSHFHSTGAWATIPAPATPTYATTSAADRGRSTLTRRNPAEAAERARASRDGLRSASRRLCNKRTAGISRHGPSRPNPDASGRKAGPAIAASDGSHLAKAL